MLSLDKTITHGEEPGIAANTIATANVSEEVTEIPEALPGLFTVASGKKVGFSRGNLVATINESGAPTVWKFARHQYDYLGAGGANLTIGTAAGDVDLFCWSTNATNNNWGIFPKKVKEDIEGYTSGSFVDWGVNIEDGKTWRTLSRSEWYYLFKSRSNAANLYQINVTVCGKPACVVVAPDQCLNGYTFQKSKMAYDETEWAEAEAAGLVCLPCAGYCYKKDASMDEQVVNVGTYAIYYSSTVYTGGLNKNAYTVQFTPTDFNADGSTYRNYGCSVRLVTDAN